MKKFIKKWIKGECRHSCKTCKQKSWCEYGMVANMGVTGEIVTVLIVFLTGSNVILWALFFHLLERIDKLERR